MSTVNAIHHINFVVRELAPQVEYLRALLQCEPIIEDLPKRDVIVSYTHLRAHETAEHVVCRLLCDKNNDYHSCHIRHIFTTNSIARIPAILATAAITSI